MGGEVLDVAFEHGVSGVRLAGLSAIVFERMADGSSVWRRNIVSDSRGRVLLDLDGLGSGREYFLRHRWGAETGQYADSSLWSEPGPVIFSVGMLRAKLVDGGTGQALGGKSVYLQQRLADGSWETAHTAVTDAGGDVLLNPSRLGTGAVYRLRAQSEVDGSWKHSAMIGSRGTLTFRVGARGVSLSVIDGVSRAPLAGVTVTTLEELADGSVVGRRRDETDANGKLELDLEGLGSGRRYLFSYQYGIHPTQYVRSAVVSSTGPFSFAVGTLQLQLLNGRTGAGYGNEVVALERQSGPNSWVNVRYVVTDAAGQAMLNPVGFGTNIAYRLRARSELDRSWKTTSPITDIGLVRFTVGGRGLNIAVVDGVSGAPLAGVRVAAFEQRADGSLSWRRTEESDAQGRLSLDLLGLDTGTRFVLRHQYGTHPSQFV